MQSRTKTLVLCILAILLLGIGVGYTQDQPATANGPEPITLVIRVNDGVCNFNVINASGTFQGFYGDRIGNEIHPTWPPFSMEFQNYLHEDTVRWGLVRTGDRLIFFRCIGPTLEIYAHNAEIIQTVLLTVEDQAETIYGDDRLREDLTGPIPEQFGIIDIKGWSHFGHHYVKTVTFVIR